MTTTPSDRDPDATSEADESRSATGPATVRGTSRRPGKDPGKEQTTPIHQAHDVPGTTTGGGGSTV